MEFTLLEKTSLYPSFSDLGKRIFLPDGIFYWSGRAKKEAELIGTIGSAFCYDNEIASDGTDEWVPCYLEEIKQYANLGIKDIVPYASIGGLAELRSIWKDWIIKKSGFDAESEREKLDHLKTYISNPIVTGGVTNGIFMACSMFLGPGETVICPNKRWGNYDNIIVKNIGAQIKSFDFFKDQKINLDGLRTSIMEVKESQEKIVLMLNFPNNPTGYVPSMKEAQSLVKLLRESQAQLDIPFIVIVDDAYEPYVYEKKGMLDTSFFYMLQQLQEPIIPIKLDGLTKELLFYGGRIGFVTIGLKPEWTQNDQETQKLKDEINNKLEGFNRSSISNANHFYQKVAINMFEEFGMDKIIQSRDKVKTVLSARYEKINAELGKLDSTHISVDPNAGGFFLFVNLNKEKVKATEFADFLLKQYKVGVIPIEKPQENINGIRIAYCSIDKGKISEFVRRIEEALKTIN
jgi:aspartate/methionine/tyrosine aminotransferase